MPESGETSSVKTRRALMDYLKKHGATDATTLGEVFKISPMAVRQHLYELQKSGLVSFDSERRPIGRSMKKWFLTNSADGFFHDGHAELTVSFIDLVKNTLGPDALNKIVHARGEQQFKSYQQQSSSDSSVEEKLDQLAKIRSAEGYLAEVQKQKDGSYLLIENHCPICSAAKSCTGLCGAELSVFQKFIGSKASVTRTEHILEGSRRCVYKVSKKT